jgi:putative flippase GtrA
MHLANFIDNIVNVVAEKMFRKKINKGLLQFFRYLICGGTSTFVDMAMLYSLTHFVDVHHLVAAPIAYVTGTATNYTLNTLLVFKSSGNIKKEFPLFAIIGIGGLFWTELILWILVDMFGSYIMVAKIISVILVLNWNFFMRKKFVFSSRIASREQGNV